MTAAAFVLALAVQTPPKKDADLVDPVRVDQAIRKGVAFLRGAKSPSSHEGMSDSDELILLTLLHAGVPPTDAKVQELLQKILKAPIEHTYKAALQAMALEELDRVKYQKRIYHCAQFLVDNQATNGQWSYGKPTTLGEPPTGTPTEGGSAVPSQPQVIDFSAPQPRVKPKVSLRIPVKKQRDGGDRGDNSNSQYAALGLKACHESGIILPRETLERAVAWWRKSQERGEDDKDGDDRKPKRPSVATGTAAARPIGWSYGDGGQATGSMTAGAVGALVIYDAILGKPWKSDPDVAEGMAWLAKNFTVSKNPGGEEEWHFYYLYALERVGMLCETEKIGAHPWYSTGARYILDAQQSDGSWKTGEEAVWDTCFAILFLRRATRPVDVASIDRFKR
jgi:hypothetical protein